MNGIAGPVRFSQLWVAFQSPSVWTEIIVTDATFSTRTWDDELSG